MVFGAFVTVMTWRKLKCFTHCFTLMVNDNVAIEIAWSDG